MHIPILTILLFLPVLTSGLTCEEFATTIQKKVASNDLSDLTTQEKFFLEESAPVKAGLGLGNMEKCEANPLMKYYVAIRVYYITLGFKTGVHHGICLPKECSSLHASQDQELLTEFFEMREWEIPKGNTLQLYDPHTPIAPKTWLFYVTCILFALFIGMSIGSAVYLHIREKKQRKVSTEPATPMSAITPASIQLEHDDHHDEHNSHDEKHEHSGHSHDHEDAHDHTRHDHDHEHEEKHATLHKADVVQVNNPPYWLFTCFDLKANIKAWFSSAKELHTDEHMEAMALLKICTCCYVVYANSFGPYVKFLIDKQSYTDFFKTVGSKLQMSGDFTSEYFFVCAGFFFAHKLIPQLTKQKFSFMVYLRLLRQRFFVIWPLFCMCVLFFWQIIPQTFTGPLGYNYAWEVESCNDVWWTKFLFVENLTNAHTVQGAKGYCLPTVWYVPAEFQVYMLGVLIFALFVKNKKLGYLACALFYLQGFGLAIAAFYKYDLTYDVAYPTLYETKFKWIPCKRWENFFLGSAFGMMYYEYSHNNKKNIFHIFETKPWFSYLTMLFGACLNMFLVFFLITRDEEPHIWNENLRHMWFAIRIVLTGFSIICFFMPLVAHRPYFLKKILQLRFFQIFARYTVDLYIYHQGINFAMYYSGTQDIKKFHHLEVCAHTILVILLGEVVATTTHLTIEKPLMKIEAKIAESGARYHPMDKHPVQVKIEGLEKATGGSIQLEKVKGSLKRDSTASNSPASTIHTLAAIGTSHR